MTLAAVALAAGAVVAPRWWRLRSQPPRPAGPPTLDSGADWSRSRVIVSLGGSFCLKSKGPDRRVVRAVSRQPPAVVDIDAESGGWTEQATDAEVGCPAVSPDGKSALFTRGSGRNVQVMLARGPDGHDAAPVVAGSSARWRPSGRGFVFATPESRLALGDLEGRFRLLPAGSPAPAQIRDIAVDGSGGRAAAIVEYGGPAAETRIELYDLRSEQRLGSWKAASAATDTIELDPVRQTFQFPEERGPEVVWTELGDGGETRVVGRLPGKRIAAAVRVTGGFLFTSPVRSTLGGLYALHPDGSEQYVSARARQFQVTPRGDLVYVHVDRDARGIIMLKRRGQPVSSLSEPENFGDPSLSPDGKVLVYDHLLTGEIFSCDLTAGDDRSRCQLVAVDRSLATGSGLALDPAGSTVAYLARGAAAPAGPLQVRLLTLATRRARGLAAVESCGQGCQIHWPVPGTIRLCPAAGTTVIEVAAASGDARERPLEGPEDGCNPQPPAPRFELRKRQAAEIRFVPDWREGGQ